MSSRICVNTKDLGNNRYRDLDVYYEKGGSNMWSGEVKPRGIYFSSQSYTQSETARSFDVGPGSPSDSGYVLVAPLKNYRPSVLKLVAAHVEAHADQIHSLFDHGENSAAISLIRDCMEPSQKEAA